MQVNFGPCPSIASKHFVQMPASTVAVLIAAAIAFGASLGKADEKESASANAAKTGSTAVSAERPDKSSADFQLTTGLTKHCERHFPGLIQAEVRTACASSSSDYARLGRSLVATRCRLTYGEAPRLLMACLIGAEMADEVLSGRESFKRKLQLCAETYPVHNEIDAFLQESCLTGAHIPSLMKVDAKARFETCAQITPERSFLGPCSVGLGLALESEDTVQKIPPQKQNKICEQFFNLRRFHKGYRACLNARGLVAQSSGKVGEAIKDCDNILSEANNDTERAACLVGLTISRSMMKQEDIAKKFQKCGDNKVTYQDRDFLACLTAASLLQLTDKIGAESGCRDIFKEKSSKGRGDCIHSLALF